ncbi:hypothetical protein [Sulfuricurvum sp.]|uniref:hypothetical protein n=1 Tax=Sulfuricurvum sp. TaxID=2025608 RepID=UPI0025E750A9|nr:hypothetical protein [Sulfuricurvum sp.]
MNVNATAVYSTYQAPQTVKVKSPTDGVEHTAYSYYQFDATSESLKPSSSYQKLKELSATYDPQNMSANDMSALANELYDSGIIGSSDAEMMKVSYSTLAKSLNDNAYNGYTGTNTDEKTNLLGIYEKMFSNALTNGASSTQTKALASKTDILGTLDSMRSGKTKDSIKVDVVKMNDDAIQQLNNVWKREPMYRA